MIWLLFAFVGIGVYMISKAIKAKHWKDVVVQILLILISTLLTVSYQWDIPQLLLPFAWMRVVFEQMSSVLYQIF